MTDAQRAGKGMDALRLITSSHMPCCDKCDEKFEAAVATIARKLEAADRLAEAVQTVMDVDGLFYSPTTAAMTAALAAYKQAGMGGES